jgi:hypothetical protein
MASSRCLLLEESPATVRDLPLLSCVVSSHFPLRPCSYSKRQLKNGPSMMRWVYFPSATLALHAYFPPVQFSFVGHIDSTERVRDYFVRNVVGIIQRCAPPDRNYRRRLPRRRGRSSSPWHCSLLDVLATPLRHRRCSNPRHGPAQLVTTRLERGRSHTSYCERSVTEPRS